MSVNRVSLSRLVLIVVLLTAVLALSTQKAFPQTESQIPRPAERENWPRLETGESTPPTGQYINATELVPFSKIVFQSYRDLNDWEIFKINDDRSGEAPLTYNSSSDIHPRFNRDATHVVFASNNDGDFEIYRMTAGGLGLTQLTHNSADDGNPYWSPDGNRIVFESYRDGQAEIYVMNADGSGQTRLTYNSSFDGYPSWSPDGSKIAFTAWRNGEYRIYTMNANGSNQVKRSNQAYSFHPVWSPDGSRIAYDADSNGNGWQEIWVMNADGSDQSRLFTPSDSHIDAWVRSWSPDGYYIAYTHIHFIKYNGNWYWDYANIRAYDTRSSSPTSILFSTRETEWNPDWQTTDGQIPVSQIDPLPATSPAEFAINWVGSDGGISGLKSYDIQIKIDNGPWQDLLTDTTETTLTYTGASGASYAFRSRARDNAHNVEAWPLVPDATTRVESLAPISKVYTLPPYSPAKGFLVVWNGSDPGGSGIQSYDIQYRQGVGGSWVNWYMGTTAGAAHFDEGNPGDKFYFRVRAIDHAHNLEEWPSGNGDATTTLYNWAIQGHIEDNTGVPIVQASSITSPSAVSHPPSNEEGEYAAYVTTQANSYMANWAKTGYGSLPDTTFSAGTARNQSVVMPPANNLVQNGNFESGNLMPWLVTGSVTPILASTSHTGEGAVYLGRPFTLAPTSTKFQARSSAQIVVGTDETVHMVWQGRLPQESYSDIFYAYKNHNGDWSSPQNISNNDGHSVSPQLAIAPNNRISVVWVDYTPGNSEIFYSQQNSNSSWTSPINLSTDSDDSLNPQIVIDKNSSRHVIWERPIYDNSTVVSYRDNPTGTQWSTTYILSYAIGSGSMAHTLLIDKHDQVHVLGASKVSSTQTGGFDAYRVGTYWKVEHILDSAYQVAIPSQAIMDREGNIHIAWLRGDGNNPLHIVQYQIRDHRGSWSLPKTLFNNNQYGLNLVNLAIGPTGTAYITWDSPDSDVFMVERDAYGTWSPVRNLSIFSTAPKFAEDGLGNLHALWHIPTNSYSGYQMAYARRDENGLWSSPQMVSELSNGYWPFSRLLVSKGNNVHMIWYRNYLNQDYIDYLGTGLATNADVFAITQQVTIPLPMTTPALSFLYQLGGVSPVGDSALSVVVNDGTATTSALRLSSGTTRWEHTWVDLSAWAGETVSVTLQLNQAANEPWVWAYVDEVTLGMAYPDVWVRVNDTAVLPGETVIHKLTYGNQSAIATGDTVLTYTLATDISFVSASVMPTAVTPTTLTWNLTSLSANSGPFTILITGLVSSDVAPLTSLISTAEIATASELETFNNTAQGSTFIGRLIYLPFITQN